MLIYKLSVFRKQREAAIKEKEAKEAAAKEAKQQARIAAKQQQQTTKQNNESAVKSQTSLKIQMEDQLRQQRAAGQQVSYNKLFLVKLYCSIGMEIMSRCTCTFLYKLSRWWWKDSN